jgi:hypothetical protein
VRPCRRHWIDQGSSRQPSQRLPTTAAVVGASHDFEPRRDPVVRFGRTARAAGPDDDLAARPRCLQLDLALHRGTRRVGRGRPLLRRRRWTQTSCDVAEALHRLGEVGDHLIALGTGQRSHRPRVIVRRPDQRVDESEGRPRIRTQTGEVVLRATTISDPPDHRLPIGIVNRRPTAHVMAGNTTGTAIPLAQRRSSRTELTTPPTLRGGCDNPAPRAHRDSVIATTRQIGPTVTPDQATHASAP